MICICITIIVLAIIALLAFYLHLTKYIPNKDRIYNDRLLMLKDKYKEVIQDYDEEDDDIPVSIHKLISLINSVTKGVY